MVPILSAADNDQRTSKRIEIIDIDRTGSREITIFGKVWPLAELQTADQFRYQEVRVRIAMPMCVCRKIDGDSRYRRRKIRAVIEVEAPQVVLIRLAFAAVLADDHAGNGFQNF